MGRHQDIAGFIKSEITEWANSLKGEEEITECPFDGHRSDRRSNMLRHADMYMKGKMASLYKNVKDEKKQQHPVMMQVVRAIYDYDTMTGGAKGNYLSRARLLLAKWTSFSTTNSSTSFSL